MDENNTNDKKIDEIQNGTDETTSTPEQSVEPEQDYASYTQQGYEQQNTPKTNSDGKATASMVCGIISVIPCCWGIVTLVLGIIAVVMASTYVKETGDINNSKAKAGKICGIIGIVGSVIGLIYVVVLLASGSFNGFNFNY